MFQLLFQGRIIQYLFKLIPRLIYMTKGKKSQHSKEIVPTPFIALLPTKSLTIVFDFKVKELKNWGAFISEIY